MPGKRLDVREEEGYKQRKHMSHIPNVTYCKAWGANFLLYFSFMLLTPLFPVYLSERFGADKDTIGLVLAGYSLMAIAARFISGYLVDTLPRIRILVISYLVFVLCTGAYLLVGSIVLFAIVRTLHGAPFGSITVANSTVAIDSLPHSRRAEGIGYYGLSNNIAMALSPAVGVAIFSYWHSYEQLMWCALAVAILGCLLTASMRLPRRPRPLPCRPFRLTDLVLWRGASPALCSLSFAVAYGIVSTYVALYSIEELQLPNGAGAFFFCFSVGLIVSRILGGPYLRQGRIIRNGAIGVITGCFGYFLFAVGQNEPCFYIASLIIGLGCGHMFPALQNIFIAIARKEQRGIANSTLLVSWDIGVGIGTLLGGLLAYKFGFTAAFLLAAGFKIFGTAFFFLHTRHAFYRLRLS